MTTLEKAKARCDGFDIYPKPVDITKVRVWESRWFFDLIRKRDFHGYALHPRLIVVQPGLRDNLVLITHELVHVWQMQNVGFMRHGRDYMRLERLHGYRDNPYEVEARFVAGR